MKTKGFLVVFLFFLALTIFFFYPVFFRGHIPFPGDLLVGHYPPWNSDSYLGYAPGGVPHKAQGIDVIRQAFPWRSFSIQMLKKGQLPLWNPYNFAGNPHLANFQTSVFYPLNIVFFLLPFNTAWTIFIILQPLLTCLFFYLFLREIKISRLAAIFAGFVFAYGLYLTVWLEWGNLGHTILWLPLALFLIEKIIKKLEIKWLCLFIFSLACSVLAGYIQTTIYLLAVVYAYFFFRLFSFGDKKSRLVKTALVLTSGLAAILLCSIQLWPTWEIFLRSAREAYSFEKIPDLLLPWFGFLVSFVPDFFGNPASRNYWLPGTYIERVTYIGVLPLFFAFLAVFYRRKEKIGAFFTVLGLVVLALTLDLFPARFFYGLKIPIMATTVPTRLLYVFSFSIAVLSGLGVDDYFKSKKVSQIRKISFVFLGFYIFLLFFTVLAPLIFPHHQWVAHLEVSQRNLILPTAFAFTGMFLMVFSSRWSKKETVFWVIVLVTVFDLFFYFKKITPFSPKEFIYPETEIIKFLQEKAGINRFWGYGTGYIETNFSTLNQTYSLEGYDPLFISRYAELISTSQDGQIKDPIPRADVVLFKGYGQEALRENPYRQRLLDLLGVKYVLQKDENLPGEWRPDYSTFPKEIYQLIWQKGSWQIYENKMALPRIFLAGDYLVENEPSKIANLIFDPEFPLKEKIILEKPLPEDFILDSQMTGEIEFLDYLPNRIIIKTKSLGNSLLFLSDNFYLGWRAIIDNQETEIYRANYSFRAVPVPKGKHQVVFSYEPDSFKQGMIVSGLTLVALLFLISFLYKKKY